MLGWQEPTEDPALRGGAAERAEALVEGLPPCAVAELLAGVRNAEAAISGYCQLACASVISADEALANVEAALALLAAVRARVEAAAGVAPGAAPLDGRAGAVGGRGSAVVGAGR